MIAFCLTFSIISYVSRVKWSNLRKGVAPSITPRCISYWKGNLRVAFVYGHQFTLTLFVENSMEVIQTLYYVNLYFLVTYYTHRRILNVWIQRDRLLVFRKAPGVRACWVLLSRSPGSWEPSIGQYLLGRAVYIAFRPFGRG